MTTRRHQLRRARFAAMALIAMVLIALAAAMGLVQVLLPLATRYPDFVAAQLSRRLHQPVKFKAISSQWQPSGPLLTITDLTLGPSHPGGDSLTLPHAKLKFDLGAWLRPSHRWISLRLDDMELRVEHSASGWQIRGFNAVPAGRVGVLRSLPVDLDLRNLRVDLVDEVSQRSWQLSMPRVRVVNVGDSIRFGASVRQSGTHQAAALSGRIDAATRDFELYAATRDLDFAAATRGVDLHGYEVHGGRGDLEIWVGGRGGKLASALLRYSLHDVAVVGADGRRVDLADAAGTLQATQVEGGWDLVWRGPGEPRKSIDEVGGAIAHWRGHPGARRLSLAAHAINVAPWLRLLALAPQVPKGVADWVAQAQPQARIDAAAVVWDGRGGYDASVHLSGLRAAAAGAAPGIELSHATVRADQAALSVELPAQPAVIALANEFRKPFVFTEFGGSFVVWREDGLWNIAAAGLHFDTGEMAGNAHAHLIWLGDGRRPFLSAYATIDHATVGTAPLFWPYRHMSSQLIAWLNRGLIGGDVTAGSVLVRGYLDDWPFLHNEGRFEATGVVRNATFDFDPKWPRATEVDASLDFIDDHMSIVATHANVQGVTVTHAEATIPELRYGVLGLTVQGNGSGSELLDFVRHSPVGADAIGVLDGITIGGSGKFDVQLSIPLHDPANFTLGGKVELSNADVTAAKWDMLLKDLSGPLLIDGKGFRAKDLTTTFRGSPARLSMAVGSSVTDPKNIVEASLDTSASAQTLIQGYPDLEPLVANVSGVAPFHIAVQVVSGADGAPATPVLHVQSSLVGIALDFPAPLDKPADAKLPVDLTLQLPPAGAPLAISLGDVLQIRGTLADPAKNRPTAMAMHFGSQPPQQVPASGLEVGGHTPRLDLGGWIQQAMGMGEGGAFPPLNRAHVGTDDAELFGTSLGPLQFDFVAGTQVNTVTFDGPAVKGTLKLPTTDVMTRGITAHFERLHTPTQPPSEQPAQPEAPSATSLVAPTAVPPLHVTVGDLRFGDDRLGAVVFESAPTAAGMHVSRFEAKGADFTLESQGDWNGTRESSQSHFVIDIAAHDLGNLLAAAGRGDVLAGGKDSHIRIDGTWPGAPSSFSMAWMTGELSAKVGEGQILEVKPGLGRLLGLLSIRELPSRLMLHFGDVFKSGFGFDHATATFTLKDGNAYTRDMLIAAPAANIAIHGRVGLRARDFDLSVDVTPHVGVALPVVGAVIGGPVGAAAGLVVQGLVGKGINKAAGINYQVTGSWDKPNVVKVDGSPAPSTSIAPAFPMPAVPTTTAPAPAPPARASTVAPATSGSG